MPPEEDFLPEPSEPQVMQVQIINRNTFTIRDMFDGIEFIFPPNRPVVIPVDAAHHIFGWFSPYQDQEGRKHEPDAAEMRRHVMRRFGWNTPGMSETGDIYYEHLKLKPIIYRMVPVAVDDQENLPVAAAPTPPTRRNKLMEAAEAAASRT